MTYTFDAASSGDPYPVQVRFRGRRTDVTGALGDRDAFDVVEPVGTIAPGSGRISVTRRVEGIHQGRWVVAAEPVVDVDTPPHPVPAPARAEGRLWVAPFVRVQAPGVRMGAWPALVGAGAALGVTIQVLLARRVGLPVGALVGLAALACILGLVGAHVYFAVEQVLRGSAVRRGMCLQGFVLAALGTVLSGALLAGWDPGTVADVTAPGLMAGAAVGRIGCFLGGCCAGRPTSSRFGLWSSDRRLGLRRVPTQLIESSLAAVLAVVALVALLMGPPTPPGALTVAVLGAYTFGRQALFPLRLIPRRTRYGRPAAVLLSASALAGAVLVLVTM